MSLDALSFPVDFDIYHIYLFGVKVTGISTSIPVVPELAPTTHPRPTQDDLSQLNICILVEDDAMASQWRGGLHLGHRST